MSRKLVHSGFLALCLGVGCLVAMAGTQVNEPGAAAPDAAAADKAVLSIEVKAAVKDAKPTHRKYPKNYEGFEKRIAEFDGKPVLDLLGNKLSIRLFNNRPQIGGNKEAYTGADFICAILRGKVISNEKMVYALQDSQVCQVTTPEGEFQVGIFYPPVGYVVLPQGECYWFLFEKAER